MNGPVSLIIYGTMVTMPHTALQGNTDVPRRLGRLTETERRVWAAFPRGELVDLRVGDPVLDDPAAADRWGAEREVRGEVIAALLLGARRGEPGCVAAVRIAGARVTGEIRADHGSVDAQLLLSQCRLEGPVNLDEAVTGPIDLSASRLTTLSAYGAHIRGTLQLRDAVVEGTPELAVHLDGSTIDGSLYARRIRVHGSFCLINAAVHGQVTFIDAKLVNCTPGGKSLNAGGVKIGRSLLAHRLWSLGELRLPGAQIGSALALDGATLIGRDGTSFHGRSLTVASSATFRKDAEVSAKPFTSYGTMNLQGARIGGGLFFTGARLRGSGPLTGPDGEAAKLKPLLAASRISVAESVYLTSGFATRGEIRLTGAQIAGHLDLSGMDSPGALVSLFSATAVGGVNDDPASWPGRLNLDGFTYGSFSRYLGARERLGMIARQITATGRVGGFRAHPYEQLAAYYRQLGEDGEARTVLLAKQRAQRARLPWWQRVPGWLLDVLVGYGYRPLRAIGWATGLLVASSVYFGQVRPERVSSEDHSVFNPVLYAADHLIPVIKFGQPEVWQYHGAAEVVTVVLTVLGWTLGIAIAAAASRTLTRN